MPNCLNRYHPFWQTKKKILMLLSYLMHTLIITALQGCYRQKYPFIAVMPLLS